MAIAAAGGSGQSVRRPPRRPRTAAIVALGVLVAACGAFAVLHWAVRGHSGAATARAATPASASASAASSSPATPAPATGHAAPARATDPFGPSLRHWLARRSGDITAAVQDLQGGRIWLYRAGHPEHTASIVKVDILATLLHERQSSGGLSATDRELATGMIESSDDDDATDLWQAAGGAPAVQGFDDSVGMTQTTTNAAWGLTRTTPQDQLKLLHAVLLEGRVLTAASRRYEYGLMRGIIPYDTWGVTAGPEHHAKIAFKNGWLPDPELWQVNSIGSVRGDGRHYLIAVMSAGNPTWDYGIDTIQRISETTWHDLDGAS